MGRSVRQKRKNRSGRARVRQAQNKKPANPTGNAVIAQNWDKTLTLSQNYRKLGLMNRVGRSAGGKEKLGAEAAASKKQLTAATTLLLSKLSGKKAPAVPKPLDAFDVMGARSAKKTAATGGVREVRVERDAQGKIVRIVGEAAPAHNPLNDPINDLEEEEEEEEAKEETEEWGGFEDEAMADDDDAAATTTPVVRALEALANRPVGPGYRRKLTPMQREWLQTLVDHYGTAEPDEDTLLAMSRDRRRNAFQRSPGDLKKRLAQFRAEGGTVGGQASQ